MTPTQTKMLQDAGFELSPMGGNVAAWLKMSADDDVYALITEAEDDEGAFDIGFYSEANQMALGEIVSASNLRLAIELANEGLER